MIIILMIMMIIIFNIISNDINDDDNNDNNILIIICVIQTHTQIDIHKHNTQYYVQKNNQPGDVNTWLE